MKRAKRLNGISGNYQFDVYRNGVWTGFYLKANSRQEAATFSFNRLGTSEIKLIETEFIEGVGNVPYEN